jgi:UDP-N-acetylmuramyl pentapeptide phosphotransferase/UDP-N-acetylglucosamine-1-phosphate transferase
MTSLFIALVAIPSIIKIAEIKNLFDEPDERKHHLLKTPKLGGVAIFAGFIFSLTFWADQKSIIELQYIIAAVILLFFMGMKDDLFDLVAYKKLMGQLLASFIIVHWGGIKITTFYGLFDIHELSLVPSYLLSIFTVVVITNSFNLIDGVDGLAALIGIMSCGAFGCWFYWAGATQYAILASCMAGALCGFIVFNWSPAKIFMGDMGTLIVGAMLSILAIKFIEMNRILDRDHPNKVLAVPVVTLAILIIPLFDTLRVFIIRIWQRRSPFSADRNHIHHALLSLGLSHRQTALSLGLFNLLMMGLIYKLQAVRGEIQLGILLLICSVFSVGIGELIRGRLS